MRTLSILCLILFNQNSFSQDLKVKKIKLRPYLEIYTIDKHTNKKHGSYRLLQKYKDTTVVEISGQYNQGIRINKWFFNYYQDSLVYNHSNDSILHIPKLIIDCDSFYIKNGNEYKLSRIDLPPIYLGYWDQIYDIIGWSKEININEYSNSNKTDRFIISGVITKTGDFGDFKIEESTSPEYNFHLLNVLKEIKGKWLSAKLNGISIDSKIFMELIIQSGSIDIPKVRDKLYYLRIYKTY